MANEIKIFNEDNNQRRLVDYDSFIFNGGEMHVRLDEIKWNVAHINARISNANGILTLNLLSDALDRCKAGIKHLYLPYFPYARQDRVCVNGEALSAKVMANLINSMGFQSVTINDPHSDVVPALVNNCIVVEQCEIFTQAVKGNFPVDMVVAPDGGAIKKAMKSAAILQSEFATADKIRNVKDGSITATRFNYDGIGGLPGYNVWVVDDICDGGRTFIELAKVIRKTNLKSLNLFVTHGIFSNGTEELFKHYDNIVTTDSFLSEAVINEDIFVYYL
jgi:ribose-phosphate pyrophosphokinase